MEAITLIAVLIASIVVHEVAHAWQARREGDDTAEKLGRITLNPLPHLDLFGSFIVPIILYTLPTGFLFGWAKPVPVNPAKYRDYVGGDIRVSMAGIVSNIGLAIIATLIMALLAFVSSHVDGLSPILGPVFQALNYAIFINLILAFFNLVPIPPLDGSHVLAHALPRSMQLRYRQFGQYGIFALMGIMYLIPGAFQFILWPVLFLQGLADSFVRLWI